MNDTHPTVTELAGAEEIQISTRRDDDSLRAFVPIWAVTVNGAAFVRSYRGTDGAWYRHAMRHGRGSIRAGGQQIDVTFTPADTALRPAIDAAYRTEYARYGDSYLQPMLADQAATATLAIHPQT